MTQRQDDEWRHVFLTELRLRGVSGPAAGEALAEVDTYCEDSGQRPAEAFGEPAGYAALRAAGTARTHRHGWRSLWMGFAGVAGGMAVLLGAAALGRDAGTAEITTGHLATVVIVPPAIAALVLLALRPAQRTRLLALIAAAVAGITLGALPVVWDGVVARVPGTALVAAGAAAILLAWWPMMSGRLLADRVVDPRTGREPLGTPPWLTLAVRFGPPALLAATAVVVALL